MPTTQQILSKLQPAMRPGITPQRNTISAPIRKPIYSNSATNAKSILSKLKPVQQATPEVTSDKSPLGFWQRTKLSFGDKEGKKAYLKKQGYEVFEDPKGDFILRKGRDVYRLDPKGFDIGDLGDIAGKAIPLATSIAGTAVGAIAGAPTGPGAIASAAAGGAAGGAAGEAARQGIGKLFGVTSGISGKEIAKEGAFGLVGGLTAGVGGRVAAGIAPRIGTRLAEGAGGELIEQGAMRAAPRLTQRIIGGAVEGGLQGGTIQGGERFIETGSPVEALKGFGQGFAMGAPFGSAFELGIGSVGKAANALRGREEAGAISLAARKGTPEAVLAAESRKYPGRYEDFRARLESIAARGDAGINLAPEERQVYSAYRALKPKPSAAVAARPTPEVRPPTTNVLEGPHVMAPAEYAASNLMRKLEGQEVFRQTPKQRDLLIKKYVQEELDSSGKKFTPEEFQTAVTERLAQREKGVSITPERFQVGITTSTSKVPEIDNLIKQARVAESGGQFNEANQFYNKVLDYGEKDAQQIFGDFPNVNVKVERTKGNFYNETEPAFLVSIDAPSTSVDDVVQRFSRLANQWQQETVHVSRVLPDLPANVKMGVESANGMVYEPNVDFYFGRKLNDSEYLQISKTIQEAGLAGSTLHPDGRGINLYNISKSKPYDEFYEGIQKLERSFEGLSQDIGGIREVRSVRELRNIGNPEYGATRRYEQVGGQVLSGADTGTQEALLPRGAAAGAEATGTTSPISRATPTELAGRGEFDAIGPGHAKFSEALDGLVRNKSMLEEDANLLRKVFFDTEDSTLGKLDIADNARFVSKGGRTTPSTGRLEIQKGLAEKNMTPELHQLSQKPEFQSSYVFLHEYGHIGHNLILSQEERNIVSEVFQALSHDQKVKYFATGLSGEASVMPKYFAKNEREFLAEAFADYVMTKQAPTPEMQSLLSRMYDKFKEAMNRLLNRSTPEELKRLEPIYEAMLSGKPSDTARYKNLIEPGGAYRGFAGAERYAIESPVEEDVLQNIFREGHGGLGGGGIGGSVNLPEGTPLPRSGWAVSSHPTLRFLARNVILPVKQIFKAYGPSGEQLAAIRGEAMEREQTLLGNAGIHLADLERTAKRATALQLNNAAKILAENKAQGAFGANTVEELLAKFPTLDETTQDIIRKTFDTTRITSEPLAEVEARYIKRGPGEDIERVATRANPFFPAFEKKLQKETPVVQFARQIAKEDRFLKMPETERFGAALAEAEKRIKLGQKPARLGEISARPSQGFEALNLNGIDETLPTTLKEYIGSIAEVTSNQANKASIIDSFIKSGVELTPEDVLLWKKDGPEALTKRLQDRLINQTITELEQAGHGELSAEARKHMTYQLDLMDKIERGDDIVGIVRKLQATKLGLSFIPNMFQSLNTLLATDFPTLAKAFGSAMTREGRERAKMAGAGVASILEAEAGLKQSRRLATGEGIKGKISNTLERFMNIYLKPFRWTEENLNRTVAANAAYHYIDKAIQTKNYNLVKGLIKPEIWEKALSAGKLSDDELFRTMNKFIQKTQFGFNPLEVPGFFNTPLGSVFFQFKNFIYRQTTFLMSQVAGEVRAGNPGRATRNLVILMTLFPAGGYAIDSLKKLVYGEELDSLDELNLAKYATYLGNTGGFGIASDLVRSMDNGRFMEFMAGPTFSELTQIAEAVPELKEFVGGEPEVPLETLAKLGTQRFGGVGTTIRKRLTEE